MKTDRIIRALNGANPAAVASATEWGESGLFFTFHLNRSDELEELELVGVDEEAFCACAERDQQGGGTAEEVAKAMDSEIDEYFTEHAMELAEDAARDYVDEGSRWED